MFKRYIEYAVIPVSIIQPNFCIDWLMMYISVGFVLFFFKSAVVIKYFINEQRLCICATLPLHNSPEELFAFIFCWNHRERCHHIHAGGSVLTL